MYELCKRQIELKIKKGTLNSEYVTKMKKNLGVFLLAEEIDDDQYMELITLMTENLNEGVA